jgi:DNA-directed RNA polymerase specialized sigma24 family protein
MQETFKKIFTDARAAKFEVNSLRKALAEVDRLLTSAPSARVDAIRDKTNKPHERLESLTEAKIILEKKFEDAISASVAAISEAENAIGMMTNPKKRAAFRYYFIVGEKSYERVAELCGVDVKTVKRWFS